MNFQQLELKDPTLTISNGLFVPKHHLSFKTDIAEAGIVQLYKTPTCNMNILMTPSIDNNLPLKAPIFVFAKFHR